MTFVKMYNRIFEIAQHIAIVITVQCACSNGYHIYITTAEHNAMIIMINLMIIIANVHLIGEIINFNKMLDVSVMIKILRYHQDH